MIEKAWAQPIDALGTVAVQRPVTDPLLRSAMHTRSGLVVSSKAVAVQRRDHPVLNTTGSNLPALFRPIVPQSPSLAGDGSAEPVLSLLSERGWTIVDTPEANIHCTNQNGRVHVQWLPEDPAAWQRGIVWTVRATPAEGEPWVQEFGPDVPSRAVAAFLEALTGHIDH